MIFWFKGIGLVKYKYVSIEILLLLLFLLWKKVSGDDESGEESGYEVFKILMECRYIIFNDSDQEDFVIFSEVLRRNFLEFQIKVEIVKEEVVKEEDEEELEDELDDEVLEVVLMCVVEVQIIKVVEVVVKVVEEYVIF